MYIHHMKMTTQGAGGNMSRKCSCGGKMSVKPHRRVMGNGIVSEVYDSSLGVVKPSKVLQNIRIKKSLVPKKYISFD